MTEEKLLRFLGGSRKTKVGSVELHLIPAAELLRVQAEAREMTRQDGQEGLMFNACLLARAARRNGKRLFSDGTDVLRRLPAETIEKWTKAYIEACERDDPSCCDENHEALMQALRDSPYERLKWYVLRRFGVLPSEERAKRMQDADYLYCVLQMMLDGEENLDRLCPSCREKAKQPHCACCGEPLPVVNAAFDEKRFAALKENG